MVSGDMSRRSLLPVDAIGIAGQCEYADDRQLASDSRYPHCARRPEPRTVTVVSPRRGHAGRAGVTSATCRAMAAVTCPIAPPLRWHRSGCAHRSRPSRDRRRGLERHLRVAMMRSFDDEPWVAGLHRFAALLRRPQGRLGKIDAIPSHDGERVGQVVGSPTVGPEAMSTGLSPGTSEMRSASTRAG